MTDSIVIYTDGGCDPNPGPGGWAALILQDGHKTELMGADPDTTNNRMELTAAIQALRSLKTPSTVTLYTDSQYLQKGIDEWMPGWLTRNWKASTGKPVLNQDLWKELLAVQKPHKVSWKWVKGHAGNVYNTRVDALVHEARRSLK